jgi:PIN domain nuclease of toxin-antitoxin system
VGADPQGPGGPAPLARAPAAYFDGLIRDAPLDVLAIEQRHVNLLRELPEIHDDPFDRMLVAQPLADDVDLVSGDERIRRCPVRTIW